MTAQRLEEAPETAEERAFVGLVMSYQHRTSDKATRALLAEVARAVHEGATKAELMAMVAAELAALPDLH